MQKKNDNFLDKIVKKDYNNELEKVLEKKTFDENVKSILLSILYKIETAYADYKKVKQNVETKEEFVENIIKNIRENCNEIKLVKPYSEESKIIGDRTFLVEKNKKRIICYEIERKLLYCISKISKKEKIIKDDYFLLNITLSNLLNVGNNINTVEPLRDFNGYSWTTIPREIESLEHNLVYQDLILLVGNQFLNNWVNNHEFIIDYMELFKNRLEEKYGEKNAEKFIEILGQLSVVLDVKFDKKIKEKILKMKKEVEKKLINIQDNKKFVESITEEKRRLAKEIKIIDETINNKKMLQNEYEKRNKELSLGEKIFSIRILSNLMTEEREEKISKIEELNEILTPKNFIKYKKELNKKDKYLRLIDTKNLQGKIDKLKFKLQKLFLECFLAKIEKSENKQEILKRIYEFRYYCLLPYNQEEIIWQVKKLEKEIEKVEKKILEKAHKLKVIEVFSKNAEIDYQLIQGIFHIRSINLEEISLKLTKEKNKFFIQLFDGKSFEEKIEIKEIENINKKDLEIKLGKKVKIFN